MSSPPPGADLTTHQLIDALVYKIQSKSPKYSLHQVVRIETRLQTLMAVLHGMINARQAINRLPTELLVKIFDYTKDPISTFLPSPALSRRYDSPVLGPTNTSDLPGSHCLELADVCRRWRGIMASHATLWADIHNSFQPEKFLRRSRNVPINVYFGLTAACNSFQPMDIDMIVPHSHRIKELHLAEGYWGSSADEIFQKLTAPAEQLQSLSILLREMARNGISSSRLPPLFDGNMPKLQQLALLWYTAWPTGYFTNLTHLCLLDQDPSSRPSTDQFLDILENSPALKELSMADAGPTQHIDIDFPTPDRLVALPHLRELAWGKVNKVAFVRRLLEHLILPKSTHMYFWDYHTYEPWVGDVDRLSALLPADQSHLPCLAEIREWRFTRPVGSPASSLSLVAFVGSIMYMCGPFQARQMESINETFPLSHVHTFFVEDAPSSVPTRYAGTGTDDRSTGSLPWKKVFSEMKQLRYLEISSPTSDGRPVSPYYGGGPPPKGKQQIIRPLLSFLHPAPGDGEGDVDAGDGFGPGTSKGKGKESAILCKHLSTLAIQDGADFPAFYIAAWAEERKRRGAPVGMLEVVKYSDRDARRRRRSRSRDSFSSVSDDQNVAGALWPGPGVGGPPPMPPALNAIYIGPPPGFPMFPPGGPAPYIVPTPIQTQNPSHHGQHSRPPTLAEQVEAQDLAVLRKHIKRVEVRRIDSTRESAQVVMYPPGFFEKPICLWSETRRR